jgi:hypothetical protein
MPNAATPTPSAQTHDARRTCSSRSPFEFGGGGGPERGALRAVCAMRVARGALCAVRFALVLVPPMCHVPCAMMPMPTHVGHRKKTGRGACYLL